RGSPAGYDATGHGPQKGADDDRRRRLPDAEPEGDDADRPDVDGGELEVRTQPGIEEVNRLAMPLLERDVLDAAGLDCGDPVSVVALTNRYVFFDLLDCLHRRLPY